ncbi:glutamate 5-kinase [Myxococcota bacterium]|nr:glutamate 5-kinase [Myxococcota bacterium]MCZ7617552.1 glutamate 5-kinase [Myxococcota bacterium]
MRTPASRARRIVVKVGSSILTAAGAARARVFTELIRQVAELTEQGRQVVVVSSGAIAMGAHRLGWTHPGRSIPEKQAAAAVGQIALMERYRAGFARRGRQVAQVLLTRSGIEDRERFLNARRTLATLLRLGVIPIVNENDTVSTEEIRFGDNDNLSANVVNLVAAELLVLLTDVDGLYRSAPTPAGPTPAHWDVVERITPEIERAAGGSDHAFGRGGMITKLEAARTAARSGAATVIANGRRRGVLLRVASGEPEGTLFLPGQERRLGSRKHWLAFTASPRGELRLDAGAAQALLERGRSLLPAGIRAVVGRFGVGDPVRCTDPDGREIARGLVAYSAQDVTRICGLSTRQIESVLGYSNGGEVIHRDDLVVLDERSS